MVYAAEPGLRDEVDEVFADAKNLGATVIRTWAFNDGAGQWNALQSAPGDYSEKVFTGLDYVIHRAGEEGLRLLLPLVNNWDDYGGMNQYVEWSSTASAHDDFYTDPAARLWYQDHAARVLGRVNRFSGVTYRDDPAIFGWELANEPRAEAKGAAVLDEWIEHMSAHVKGIDPNHLVSTGSEGFYGVADAGRNPVSWMARTGVDFRLHHAHPGIDFASLHAYPDQWALSPDATAGWLRDHLETAATWLGKPVLLGEFGKREPLAGRNDFFRACYQAVIEAQAPGRASAGLFPWILYHDAYPDYDGFGIYYPDPRHAETVAIIQDASARISAAVASATFIRADANCDGAMDISDPIETLLALFTAAGEPCCEAAADANGDAAVDVADAVYALAYLFAEGSAPPAPFPACGAVPDPASAGCARSPCLPRG